MIKRRAIAIVIVLAAATLLYQLVLGGDLIEPTPDIFLPMIQDHSQGAGPVIRFAVIGDYGEAGDDEKAVADMVKSWVPDFIITTGDNNYDDGEAETIDANVGQYYSEFIYPYSGAYMPGESPNRFFPSLGNHDWYLGNVQPYLDYFPISESAANTGSSGNERYYDFLQEPVHFLVLDSDNHEPDGTMADSDQAAWLQQQLATSTSPWQVVYFHHPPYSSGKHGSTDRMQWPFSEWGADVVITGHEHSYERLIVDGFPYFVNGAGGRNLYSFGEPIPGSIVRHNDDHGAMWVTATEETLTLEFYSVSDWTTPIDRYTIRVTEVVGES